MKNAAVEGLVIKKVYSRKITQMRNNFMVRKPMLYQMSAILGLFFLDLKDSCYKRIIREKLAKAI